MLPTSSIHQKPLLIKEFPVFKKIVQKKYKIGANEELLGADRGGFDSTFRLRRLKSV